MVVEGLTDGMSTGVIMLDGPYGGSSVDLGLHESVFLVAGGSDVAFTLGLLDDIVGKCVKLGAVRGNERGESSSPGASDLLSSSSNSTIDLHISIFVTCLWDPEAVPHIPNTIGTLSRPSIQNLLKDFNNLPSSSNKEDSIEIRCDESQAQKMVGLGGGVAVCTSGSESLTKDAQNAVVRLGLIMGVDVGRIALHTDLFTL
ncbi:hypothetical protein EV424DRAFT_1547869 [Suillus variegatus]|nr:hypothetical protein EV424DRAFT_1547869 [Suillus variegatus]